MRGSETGKKKHRSGIPTANAGEYFVMGELLRRGYDAQLDSEIRSGACCTIKQTSESGTLMLG